MRGITGITLTFCLLAAGPGGAAPGKAPASPNVLTGYLDGANVHPGIPAGRLTIFPISLAATRQVENVLTMQQALDKKLLVIEELASAAVNTARFTNRSPRMMIFLMAGEMVTGGKQNRTLATDALLGPDSTVTLPVYCVQKGRWKGRRRFAPKAMIVPQGVREKAAAGAGQGQVWSEVARANVRLKHATPSEDLAAAMAAPVNLARLSRLRGRIVPGLPGNTAGVVVARGREIVGADLFNSAELFAAMRDKVLDAYLSEHGLEGPVSGVRAAGPTQGQVRQYLRACYRARFTAGQIRGVGRIYHIRGSRHGQTLAYENPIITLRARYPYKSPVLRYMIHTALMRAIVPVR